jgi:hypothetical protein
MKAILLGILATLALGAPAAASAAPSGPSTAADTVQGLQANGYKVILNKVGDAPLEACSVAGVHPGRMITRRTTDSGGDSIDKVVYTTVYVDLLC